MNLRTIITISMIIFVINGCNRQESVEILNTSIESEMKALGEAFRFGARMQYAASRNSSVVENSDELEEGMVEYLKNEYGEQTDDALAEFKSSEAFIHISQTMDDLSTFTQNSSGRLSNSNLELDEELNKFTAAFGYVNTSENFKIYVEDVNKKITLITNDFMNKVNQSAEQVDGEYYISIDSVDEKLHTARLKSEIVQIENEIMADESLTNDEKQNLFNYTTAMLMNVDNIVEYTTLLDPDEYLNNGRVAGWFKKIGNLFKRVITAVVTVVTTAITTAIGIIAGSFAGGVPGAIIGGVAGFTVGLEFSFYLSCKWGLSTKICLDCKKAYPSANITC